MRKTAISNSKKHSDSTESTDVDTSARSEAVASPKAEPAPVSASSLVDSKWSFDGVLRRVLGFSRAADFEGTNGRPEVAPASSKKARSKAAAPAAPPPAAAVKPAATNGKRPSWDALNQFVRTLDTQTVDKLRTVMQAGRTAQTLGAARTEIVTNEKDKPLAAADLFVEGALSLEHLQRGHAIACATAFDLEKKVTRWSASSDRASLEDRVWFRFGRELALSNPAEWSCLGLVDAGDQLEMLFLRRGESRWWSFDAVVDRPSAGQVARQRTLRARDKHKLVTLPLEAVVGRRCRSDRRALRRAALAMSARLGFCRLSSTGQAEPG